MKIEMPERKEYSLESLPINIREKIQVIDGHWIWIGAITNANRPDKKGRLRFNGKMEYPHRVIFHLLTGFNLSSSSQVNHKRECQVSLCCNPSCLYEGTQQENIDDREELEHNRYADHTHCDACNSELKISPTTGHKYCQVCKNNRRKAWRNASR